MLRRLLPLLLLASPLAAQSAPAWGPAPSFMAPGAQVAILQGDPGKPGVYTLRLKLPAGYVIAPHFHPTDENVTVISGEFLVGMGDDVDRSKAQRLGPGGFVTAPAQAHHFAVAAEDVIVQVHGMGPFAITYVRASDDPRRTTGAP
ncbi:MAG TPA: cupin domain-containing protein [Gemmatimonadales bacterium]|nr:cupin domain-containing protein [Gemmatimonadales bacterium]